MPPQIENNFSPINTPVQQKPSRKHAFLIILTTLLILTGIFGVWYFSNPLPNEETETLATTNQFVDWETYRNEKYGFEIKYPNNSILTVIKDVSTTGSRIVNELPPDTPHLLIENGNVFVSICVTKSTDCGSGGGIGIHDVRVEEQIIIDGETYKAGGFYLNTEEGTHKILFINLPGLEIRYGYRTEYGKQLTKNQTKEAEKNISKILSTLKFNDPTTNWKTYLFQGFNVRYPLDWTIKEESIMEKAEVVLGKNLVLYPPFSKLRADTIVIGMFGIPTDPGYKNCKLPSGVAISPEFKNFKCDDSSGMAISTHSSNDYVVDTYELIRKSFSNSKTNQN